MNVSYKRSNRFRVSILLTISVIVTVTLLFAGCFSRGNPQQGNETEPVHSVKTVDVKRQDLSLAFRTSGVIGGNEERKVTAEASAVVKEVRKGKGAKVMVGEVIILLDNSEALTELGKVENNLAVLENDYLQAVSDKVFLMEKRDDVRKSVERLEKLYQLGQVSYYDLEDVRAEVTELESRILAINLNALQDAVNRGRLAVEAARKKLTSTVVTSPFEGIITEMAVKNGQTIRKGESFFTIGKKDLPEAIVSVPQKDIPLLPNGTEALFYSEKYPEKVFEARVSGVMKENVGSSKEAGSVEIKVVALERAEELSAGLPVDVEIILAHKPQVLTIPVEAITEIDGQKTVLVYDDGLAKQRKIVCGIVDGGLQEVFTGIKETERVILCQTEEVKDGAKVRIATE